MNDGRKPEWADGNASFASSIKKGLEMTTTTNQMTASNRFVKKNQIEDHLQFEKLAVGVLEGSRTHLGKAITLVESNSVKHFDMAQNLLQHLMPHTGKSIRIGISGVPGAGKSTFIEAFGMFLCSQGYKVAVLAVDPSSSVTGGSILGDKTRMEELAKNQSAFIRPSPSEGTLGGVHRKTRETMMLCEAAGYDIILIETVGVGQSEAIVRGMVDYFLLLALTGAGDELQGMKKGIMELVDGVVINKADGSNKPLAMKTKEEFNRILHFLQPATKGWQTEAYTCSSKTGEGIQELWDIILQFVEKTKKIGVFQERRRLQVKEWMQTLLKEHLNKIFFHNPSVKNSLPKLENEVMSGTKTVSVAVLEAFDLFLESMKDK
ncbi:methylmalonyl Co-A mutase-associated GTPase MeaB [Peribacillus alkalitolerans]|uniref:methylmalonyl Co-A mutase-associated GTPase MeaB n=1 Tax=Peribacillus alkalitolerans TaxID=1550385 RepID=UPI0013D690D6|nr:methylmalonyl Co-A mutase-associated GTPase MeaB [Peribacillus alkalitolerans]